MNNQQTPFVLIGDDDIDDQEFLAEAFLSLHPEAVLRFFHDGAEILSFLHKSDSDRLPVFILLDYKMPIVSAPEVLEAMEKEPRYQGITKIVWSTSDNPEFTERCYQHGAERYFAKPSNPAQMAEIIAYLSQVYRSRALKSGE